MGNTRTVDDALGCAKESVSSTTTLNVRVATPVVLREKESGISGSPCSCVTLTHLQL